MNPNMATEQRQLSTATAAQLVNGALMATPKSPQQSQDTSLELVRNESNLAIQRAPAEVLEEASKAAMALADVIARKPKKVIFNGEQYLEFEDWQTVARFYGLTVRVRESRYVEFGDARGFEATADVLQVSSGQVISSAESMCLDDEERWRSRPKYEGYGKNRRLVGHEPVPLFQLRSMAQTRASAKAFRNVLSWVVVLAGYRGTPAEEMDGVPGFMYGMEPADETKKMLDQAGVPANTKEASDFVLQRKLAEIGYRDKIKDMLAGTPDQEQGVPGPDGCPPPPPNLRKPMRSEKPWKSTAGRQETFRVARERVGEVIWNAVLSSFNVDSPAQFSDLDALAAYQLMLNLAKEVTGGTAA